MSTEIRCENIKVSWPSGRDFPAVTGVCGGCVYWLTSDGRWTTNPDDSMTLLPFQASSNLRPPRLEPKSDLQYAADKMTQRREAYFRRKREQDQS